MIADLDETIRQLLRDELPIKNGEIDVKFDQPKREWSAKLNKPTINFYLYDLRENHVLRQHQWERMGGGNGSTVARMKRTPFRVDCYYMITVWAAEPEDCHRLLSRCMTVLFRYPILPQERLLGEMQEQPFDIQTRLASHDKLTNPAEVWSALDNEIRPSISYLVTLAIDPWQVIEGPAVRSYSMQTGTMSEPGRRIDPEETPPGYVTIGGTVRDKEGAPQSGLDVAFKGTGFVDRTDARGRYRLGSAPPGEYTLVVWPEKGKPKERKINVPPTADDDYDLTL
jgi:hypothetical protein